MFAKISPIEFVNELIEYKTVGLYGNREVIRKYIENQGKPVKDYEKVYFGQLTLF